MVEKVRYSEQQSRNYQSEQGQKHIWHRYNRETERIENGSDQKVVNITLDVWDKNEFESGEHHVIFLTEHRTTVNEFLQQELPAFQPLEFTVDLPPGHVWNNISAEHEAVPATYD